MLQFCTRGPQTCLILFVASTVHSLCAPLDAMVQEERSAEIFQLARRRKIFPGLLHHLGDLDLHDLSVGAALVALRWWLQASPPGERLNIITEVGKSRKPWRDADLRTAVADVLRRLESF